MEISMTELLNPNNSQLKRTARKIVVPLFHRSVGYHPFRMKTVHFATSFLLCVSGRYRILKLLNQVSNPKSVEKSPGDPYVTSNLYELLKNADFSPLGQLVSENDFAFLRNHLCATFNNDGAALGAAFPPYSTYGFDFSTPSPEFLANASKNHGNAGALVYSILTQTVDGQLFLELAKKIFESSSSPSAALGMPFVEKETEDYPSPAEVLSDDFPVGDLGVLSQKMTPQTKALLNLARNLDMLSPAYALRQLIIGVGSWFLLYLIKTASGEDALVVPDFSGLSTGRIRTQARACFARHISAFGRLVSTKISEHAIEVTSDEIDAFQILSDDVTTEFEGHFNDFSIRIGWAQPRATNVKQKHFETVPDTLRVLLMSILAHDEIVTIDEIAERLLDSWRICIGLVPTNHDLLTNQGYSPLDHDADLRVNRRHFKNLAIALGLAREPSDGLVLFSLDPQTIS